MCKQTICYYFILLFVFSSCVRNIRENDKNDRSALANEMRGRKVKRVTDGELLAAALSEGKTIATKLDKIVLSQVSHPDSLNCDLNHYLEAAEMQLIFLKSFKIICATTPKLSQKEKEIWEAYEKNSAEPQNLLENIQKLGDSELLYTAPIVIDGRFVAIWSIILDKRELIKNL